MSGFFESSKKLKKKVSQNINSKSSLSNISVFMIIVLTKLTENL